MSEALRAGIYQYRCRDEAPIERLKRLDEMLASRDGELDLVVCPELFLSGYNVGERVRQLAEPRTGSFREAASALARRRRTALVYGYPELAEDVVYNAAICIDAEGRTIAHHRKLRLPSDFERSTFSTGDAYTSFRLKGWDVAMLVCYDVEFPETVRACSTRGAQLIVAPTALRREWAFVARTVIPTRAFENGVFLAYANYCGNEGTFEYLGESCFVSPKGAVTAAGDQETLLTADLDAAEIKAARQVLPYLEDCAVFAARGP
jgi:predicted amidohydrolase